MSTRTMILALAMGLTVSIVGVGVWAQDSPSPRVPEIIQHITPPDRVIDGFNLKVAVVGGEDVGIRILTRDGRAPGLDSGTVTGRLVVKIDGRWVNVRLRESD
jgi:hypothetical protein